MKRRNVQLAFIGEGSTAEPNVAAPELGDEAVDIEVLRGSLMLVVPAGTEDAAIFEAATVLGGELELENGLRLTFEIQGEAVGARFAASDSPPTEEHVGLSGLTDIPSGV